MSEVNQRRWDVLVREGRASVEDFRDMPTDNAIIYAADRIAELEATERLADLEIAGLREQVAALKAENARYEGAEIVAWISKRETNRLKKEGWCEVYSVQYEANRRPLYAAPVPAQPVSTVGQVTKYWLDHYCTGLCTLCGNLGRIDTRGVRTAAGVEVGRVNYCICPNGQALRGGPVAQVPEGFDKAWAAYEAKGYHYGEGALENVRFGWEIACATLISASPTVKEESK